MKKTSVKRTLISALLVLAVILSMSIPALAAVSEETTAAAYLVQKGIMFGDEKGNLNLNSGLTRAELATLIVRVNGVEAEWNKNPGKKEVIINNFNRFNTFRDMTNHWAIPYVEYCRINGLMAGYSTTEFGPNGPVSSKQICTLMLRWLGLPDTKDADWSYDTAIAKAKAIGIAHDSVVDAPTIRRGDMAIIIYRAMLKKGDSGTVEPTDGNPFSGYDYSQEANPAIFGGLLTRELYNYLRTQIVEENAVLEKLKSGQISAFQLKYQASSDEWFKIYTLLRTVPDFYNIGAFGGSTTSEDKFSIRYYDKATKPYSVNIKLSNDAEQKVQEFLKTLTGLSGFEKFDRIGKLIGNNIAYDEMKGKIRQDLTDSAESFLNSFFTVGTKGNCMYYAYTFNYLCYRAGFISMSLMGRNHEWNIVFVDGKWWGFDGIGGLESNNGYRQLSESFETHTVSGVQKDKNPEATRFIQELLVPGSTKGNNYDIPYGQAKSKTQGTSASTSTNSNTNTDATPSAPATTTDNPDSTYWNGLAKVPAVVGLTEYDAKLALVAAGFQVETKSVITSNTPEGADIVGVGKVYTSSIVGGAQMKNDGSLWAEKGTKVVIYVNAG
ncbi:MAG: S-layer homology domain-containing protein [Oscillospiraceae bacterium]|jgi:hypothetical protein|nr:S-layer homology domain-containing protein [Oscillospiraceae bacterium]